MPETTTQPTARPVRWILPTGHREPIPAWQDDAGHWLLGSVPRLIPAGTRTHQLIEAASPTWSLGIDPDDGDINAHWASRPGLFALLDRVRAGLVETCLAEHANAVHVSQPEPGCPECESDADMDAAYAENARWDAESVPHTA